MRIMDDFSRILYPLPNTRSGAKYVSVHYVFRDEILAARVPQDVKYQRNPLYIYIYTHTYKLSLPRPHTHYKGQNMHESNMLSMIKI